MYQLRSTARFLGASLLILILVLGVPGGAAGAGSARAQHAEDRPLLPVTIASHGPIMSGGAFIGALGSSGPWVAYLVGRYGCGHCSSSIDTLHLRDVVNARSLRVRASTLSMARNGDSTIGAEGILFSPPYLVWSQPASMASAMPQSELRAGDFDCSICFFDARTGQGGAIAPLQALDPGKTGIVLPLAIDPAGSGRILALLDSPRGAQLYLVSVATGDTRQIPLPGPPAATNVHSAAISGPAIAWASGAPGENWRLFVYREDESRVVQADVTGRGEIAVDGAELAWTTDSGVVSYDLLTGKLEQLQLPAGAARGIIAGGRIAWTEYQGQGIPPLLRVARLRPFTMLLEKPLVAAAKPGNSAMTGLAAFSGDKLLFETQEFGPVAGPPAEQRIELAWLEAPDPAFQGVWSRADAAVAAGQANRSWLWGPEPRFIGREAYVEGGGAGRQVYYYDKSRMEVNDPGANPNDPHYVTNGLLVSEMLGGEFQLGNATFVPAAEPCTVPVAGDPRLENPLTPDYATLSRVASTHGQNEAVDRTGQAVDDAIDAQGSVSKDQAHGALSKYAQYAPQTGHNIPDVFLGYLRDMPATYGFDWTFVVGYPITEAYWTRMRVGGKEYAVMIQAFQRRVLTYTPDFEPAWRIQQGNVGQHYLEWRYTINQ